MRQNHTAEIYDSEDKEKVFQMFQSSEMLNLPFKFNFKNNKKLQLFFMNLCRPGEKDIICRSAKPDNPQRMFSFEIFLIKFIIFPASIRIYHFQH